MERITKSIDIHADPSRVFQAITTTEGERAWWTTDCEVGNKEGEAAVFRFEGKKMEVRFRIDRLDTNRTVEWTCVGHQNNPDWQDTRVAFRLSHSGQGTRLEFEHTGWRAKTKVYEMCDGGWSHFMNSLKSYVETGSGTPHGAAA